ncbi:MAG: hypothetical protein LBU20_02280 [Candidatus Nomurabacteria bacterium]|jgi:hypothetical protein|nr:hypothetical protein [Candidatus Nomurabacteria bacterium]
MVCVAAFIVLALCVLSLPAVRIFNRPAADSIWKLFRKSVYCFTHRVTFRKCDSTFKDDIKNSLLRKVVVKHANWVKPLSAVIETLSVVVILLTVWSLLVAFKSGVNLLAYDTCTPDQPEACVVGNAEACSAVGANDGKNILEWTGNWFVEIGDALAAIPPKFADWPAADFLPENPSFYSTYDAAKPVALDIFDPSCKWCKESFKNQLDSGFLERYNVAVIPYALKDGNDFRFKNSDLLVRYLEAVKLVELESSDRPAQWRIIERIFTESNQHGLWQNDFINYYDNTQARAVLNDWLAEFGYSSSEVERLVDLVDSAQVAENVAKNRHIVENQIKIVKIPTTLFDGKRHDGVYKP